jgi:hypothetical protein
MWCGTIPFLQMWTVTKVHAMLQRQNYRKLRNFWELASSLCIISFFLFRFSLCFYEDKMHSLFQCSNKKKMRRICWMSQFSRRAHQMDAFRKLMRPCCTQILCTTYTCKEERAKIGSLHDCVSDLWQRRDTGVTATQPCKIKWSQIRRNIQYLRAMRKALFVCILKTKTAMNHSYNPSEQLQGRITVHKFCAIEKGYMRV